MARHSHWHNVQVTKGKADAKRAKTFAKHAKTITTAAKDGGADPTFNVSLRVAVDAARAANMPKDNIDRAIARGTGEGGEGVAIEEVVYEGFGPGGLAILVQCLTDNRNRSVSEVRTVMMKNGGTMANAGSVMWMFEKKGVVVVADRSFISDRDAFELTVIDAGADDVREVGEALEIITPVTAFKSVYDAVEGFGLKPDAATLAYVPKDSVAISETDSDLMQHLIEKLEALDDVDVVSTNER